jgi:hypothetical protein
MSKNPPTQESSVLKQKQKEDHDSKVHVFATYTSRALTKQFHAHLDQTVQQVINETYSKLGETPRTGDSYFGGDDPHRVDLAPYLNTTLADLAHQHIAIQPDHHHKGDYELAIEIENQPGGA